MKNNNGWWLIVTLMFICDVYDWCRKHIVILLNVLGWYICVPFLLWLFNKPHWIYFCLWYITITLAILMYYALGCMHIAAEEEQRRENEAILKDMQDEDIS